MDVDVATNVELQKAAVKLTEAIDNMPQAMADIVPSRLPEIFMILAIIAAVFYLFLIHGVVKTDSENKKVVDERPPPAQPPKPSNQGQRPVCSSHAIAKALVDILDGFGYDCDQQDIIDKLGKSI